MRKFLAAAAAACCAVAVTAAPALADSAGTWNVTTVATGLDSPRHLAWASDGSLLVAEAGHGGDLCIPDGPCVGLTSQLSSINVSTGAHTVVASGLISANDPEGGATGLDGISTLGDRTLGIMTAYPQAIDGASCDQIPSAPADCQQILDAANAQLGALLRFHDDGSWTKVADVGRYDYAWNAAHPGGDKYGHETDSNPYGVLAIPNGAYVADAGTNTLDWVSTDGKVVVVKDFPVPAVSDPEMNFPSDAVPTCVVMRGQDKIVGDLAGRIWRVFANGKRWLLSADYNRHYTACAGDNAGNVYFTNLATGPFPAPGVGSVVKLDRWNHVTTLAGTEHLNFPNGIALADDGTIYVSNNSVCFATGGRMCGSATGEVVALTRGGANM